MSPGTPSPSRTAHLSREDSASPQTPVPGSLLASCVPSGLGASLTFFRLGIVLQALEPIDLPPHAGPTLRGAFGQRLKMQSCKRPGSPCHHCPLVSSCAYGFLFETPNSLFSREQQRWGFGNPPHPLVVRWTRPVGTPQSAGTRLPLEVIGTSTARPWLPETVAAIYSVAQTGLGRTRARAKVVALFDLGEGPPRRLSNAMDLPELRSFRAPPDEPRTHSHLDLVTLAPLRIHRKGRLLAEPVFADVIVAAYRRVRILEAFHATPPPAELTRPAGLPQALLDLARRVETRVLRGQRTRIVRTSGRSGRQSFEGFSGSLRFEGDLRPFMPLLSLGSLFGIGKGTGFGFGQYLLQAQGNGQVANSSIGDTNS